MPESMRFLATYREGARRATLIAAGVKSTLRRHPIMVLAPEAAAQAVAGL